MNASGASLRGITSSYPGRPPVSVLRGVDLEVDAGSFTAVLGPSGCGKTTLLRVLAGLHRVDGGTLTIGDRIVDGPDVTVPPERRGVGLVPQEGALFPHLDVAANVAFGLGRVARAERSRRVAELLELVGLGGFERRRPHELSGGQQQRVALARALAPEPGIVLLDEPFSALDAGLRATVRAEVVATLRAAGSTAVLVTHDQVEALSTADRVAVMRDGRITQCASPADVYHRPVDAWTGAFVGESVVLPGTVLGGGRAVRCALGELPVASAVDAGAAVDVFLRPEQIRPADAPSGVPARVVDRSFEGSQVAVRLSVDGVETEVAARWSSTEVVPAIGEHLSVAVLGAAVVFGAP